MSLDAGYNRLLTINCFLIHLQHTDIINRGQVKFYAAQGSSATHRADSCKVVLFDVGTKSSIASISPASQSPLSVVWLNVADLFPQVIEAKR